MDMTLLLKIALLAIATEAVTEILVESELFEWLRAIMRKTEFTAALFSCGWCLSVWVAGTLLLLTHLGLFVIVILFAVHRLANVWHNLTHPLESDVDIDEVDLAIAKERKDMLETIGMDKAEELGLITPIDLDALRERLKNKRGEE